MRGLFVFYSRGGRTSHGFGSRGSGSGEAELTAEISDESHSDRHEPQLGSPRRDRRGLEFGHGQVYVCKVLINCVVCKELFQKMGLLHVSMEGLGSPPARCACRVSRSRQRSTSCTRRLGFRRAAAWAWVSAWHYVVCGMPRPPSRCLPCSLLRLNQKILCPVVLRTRNKHDPTTRPTPGLALDK